VSTFYPLISGSVYSDWLRAGLLKSHSSSPGRVKNVPLPFVQTGSGVHPASYPVDTEGSIPRGKASGAEAYNSPPTSAEINLTWVYTSTPPYTFIA
jgi:hypothetical protein